MYHVLLYYNFFPIENPAQFCVDHKDKCRVLELKGRVLIAPEGINGTLAGSPENISKYKKFLCRLPGFADTAFKEDATPNIPFFKLIVKARPEIVTLKSPHTISPKKEGGRHLSPQQWREALESDEEYVILDVRNNYETRIGHFEGAITPDVRNFYDFPEWLKRARIDKKKKILMYCTGGIRCEKFSVHMKKEGYHDIGQLDGGIVNYAKTEGGKHFKGKCFIFDDRLEVGVSEKSDEPISRCAISGVPCDTYINCANPECNKLFLCAKEAAVTMQGCCSEECKKSPRRRPFNPEDIYTPYRKWYCYGDKKL